MLDHDSYLLCPSHHSGGGSDRTAPTLLINALRSPEYHLPSIFWNIFQNIISFFGIFCEITYTFPQYDFLSILLGIFYATRNTPEYHLLSIFLYFPGISYVTRNTSPYRISFPEYFYGVFCVTRNTFLQNMIC